MRPTGVEKCGYQRCSRQHQAANNNSIFLIFLAKRRPFMIFFRTNGNEAEDSGGLAAQTGLTNEQEDYPGGIIGFSLDFKQSISC